MTANEVEPTAPLPPVPHEWLARARAERDALQEWKDSALAVMAEWDLVFDALGKPGPLGASKAASSLAEVKRAMALYTRNTDVLVAERDEVRAEVERLRKVQAAEPRNLSELRDRLMLEGWDITSTNVFAEAWSRGGTTVFVLKRLTPDSWEWAGTLRRVGAGGVCPACGANR